MNSLSQFLGRIFALFLAASVLALAQGPPLLTSGVEVGSSNEKTALVRATGRLSSTVDVKIKNTGDRPLPAPLHAVITFTALNGGNLNGLTVPGSSGGIGLAPYQTFYWDLSASIGDGLAAGAETTFRFTFERPSTSLVSYAISIHGMRNSDPVASIGGPYSGQLGIAIPFNAAASTDPDGDALTYAWDFGDGGTAAGSTPQHAFSSTGLFTVTLTVTDASGAVVSRETQVPIAPPGVFALARTRTLDGNGHPLGEVTVVQTAPNGSKMLRSDSVSGFASLGGAPGEHVWSFARAGHLTSYRKATLDQGQVKVVAFPWLAALSDQRYNLSILNPTVVKSPSERVTLTFPPEAFEQVESVAVTDLHGQSLPLPLPYGWSPLAAFHLDIPVDAAGDVAASLKLLQNVPGTRQLALVRLDTESLTWQTASLIAGTGTDVITAVLRKSGSYAVVIADTLPTGNPAAAVVGSPLPPGDAPSIAQEVTAVGVVNPQSTIASVDPGKVTATATVDFTNAGQPLASGAWFLADVEETYDLADGQAFKTPNYDATFYAYQTPGDSDATTSTATFPMRPRILFGPELLKEAHIKADVLALNTFAGGILTTDGGSLNLGGIRIQVPPGAVDATSASEIRQLNTSNLSRFLGGFEPLMAFELNLPELADGTVLNAEFLQKLSPDSHFVLARCVNHVSDSGLQPVQRLISDSQGKVTSAEPTSGTRLPGIAASGKYVLVKINEPQALITGLVRKVGGALLPAALVRVSAEPWLSLTGAAGTFSILAKPGERKVTGSNPADGNSGQATASLANAASTANVEIQTAPSGPRVVATTPTDGATKVKPTTPITVRFSEPLDPSSFGPTALNVTNPHGVKVIGSLSLNNAGTEATFLPINPLEQAAHYRIELASTVRDRSGLSIEGQRTFTFAVIPFFERPVGAQLVIYEPDAKNVPQSLLDQLVGYVSGSNLSMVVATGSPGTADPEVPVILFNEESAETATVLSKPDGSFATFINASAGDFIKAAFVNSNGTVVTVPATRQLFDDGRVGLYKYGGILEAESDGGPVQVLIEPEAIKERSVFKVDVFSVNQLAELTGGVLPEGENTALPGVKIEVEGAPPEGGAEISFPLNPDSLGLVPGVTPEEAGFALTTPVEIDGQIVYLTVDSMRFENGKLFTNTCPFKGAYNPQLLDDAISIGANIPGVVGATTTAFQTLVPILVAKTTGGVVINGSVAQLPVSDVKLIEKVRLAQLAATVISIVPQPLNFNRIAKLVALEKKIKALQVAAGSALAEDVVELGIRVVEEVQTNGAPPVQGALIALRSNDAVFDGRIKPGIVCAISDENGCYSLKAPALGGLKLVGTHPRLGRAADVGLGAFDFFDIKTKGFIARNVFFGINDEFLFSNTRPRLAVSQSPLDPQIGQPVTVTVDAFARAGLPVSIAYSDSRSEFQTRLLGQGVSSSDVVVTAAPPMEVAPGQTRVVFTVTGAKSMNAVLVFQADAAAEDGSVSASIGHAMSIGATRPQITNPLAPSDPEDKQPPQVVSISPSDGSFLYPGQKVFVRFSEPLDKASILEPGGVTFGTLPYPELSLSADQTTLEVLPRNLPQGGSVTMTLGFSLADLADNRLAPSVSTSFFLGSLGHAALPGVGSGGGTVLDASTLYVLDRGPSPGVRVFDVSNPFSPFQRIHVPAVSTPSALDFPRDLALIKDWSHVPSMEGNNERPATIRPLLAVVGGLTGSAFVDILGNATQQGQYLTILDISNPSAPQLVQNVQITVRPSTVPKVRWEPPFLTYLENSADSHFVSIVDLQELLIGFSVPTFQRLAVFGKGRKGTDINGDGDYTDVNEFRPKPNVENVSEFIGFARGYDVLPFPRQRIEDFDGDGLGDLAVVRSLSGLSEPIPTTARPEFRLLMAGGNDLPQEAGFTSFERGARPKRVLLLPEVRSEDGTVRNLAVVSLSPDADGKQKLAVVDWSQTVAPLPVKKILLPDDAAIGVLQSPSLGADGLLRVAATSKVLIFDPAKLLFDGAVGAAHPSLVAILPEGGSGTFSIGENDAGVRAVALGGRNELTVSPPSLGFVQFSGLAEVPRPDTLNTSVVERDRVLAAMRRVSHLRPARFRAMAGAESSLSPPSPLVHSHVLVNAPGGAGRTIPLLLQSLNEAGKPIAPKGVDYPPVHAGASLFETKQFGEVSEDINPTAINFTGYRISDDPSDPSYNLYLSDPIVVLREKVSAADLRAILTARARVVLWSEAAVRATIDISAPPPLNLFSADFDRQAGVYRPKVAAFASTLPGGYVPGSTAPPVGGELPIPGTFGTIDAASGEFRHSTVDLGLPSRRLPIVFERTATSHALVSSAFGRGWDFVYNQRAIELKAELVPPGQQEPITERGGPGKDKVGASTDIILSNGAGHAILFKNRGRNAPPGVDNDPLINLLGWNITGGEFYTPAEEEKGVFDLMYRYPSGEKARLTPEGVLFRYNEAGLLTKIEDRYPKNAQLLDYNINGELIRIRDLSVSDDRMVRLGYFRVSAGVAGFDSQVDKAATKGLHVGRICSLVDFAGRRVDFEYDDNGRLVRRLGISVEGENNGFVGRPQVTYTIDPATKAYTGVIAGAGAHGGGTSGNAGTPLSVATTTPNSRGEAVANETKGAGGAVAVQVPAGRSAATVANGSTAVSHADASNTAMTFDANGYLAGITMTGPSAGQATYGTTHNARGLPETITYPEGNSVTFEY